MSYDDTILKIEKLENGYTVCVVDEKIAENNKKPKARWEDPWKEYGFSNDTDVLAFVTKRLATLKKPPSASEEYDGAFKTAIGEDD